MVWRWGSCEAALALSLNIASDILSFCFFQATSQEKEPGGSASLHFERSTYAIHKHLYQIPAPTPSNREPRRLPCANNCQRPRGSSSTAGSVKPTFFLGPKLLQPHSMLAYFNRAFISHDYQRLQTRLPVTMMESSTATARAETTTTNPAVILKSVLRRARALSGKTVPSEEGKF